eukprot:GHVH01003641.1.p2 GENE.GHVH01003641.1~~GHVH01003641.1.p2  ORF type:complete len:149 (+),score=3.63 GHVH01003641.1:725-1171(+)
MDSLMALSEKYAVSDNAIWTHDTLREALNHRLSKGFCPQSTLCGISYQFARKDAIFVDGQKGGHAVAIVTCGRCKKVKDSRISRCVQASQATSEQRALLNGAVLAKKISLYEINTDHAALTLGLTLRPPTTPLPSAYSVLSRIVDALM